MEPFVYSSLQSSRAVKDYVNLFLEIFPFYFLINYDYNLKYFRQDQIFTQEKLSTIQLSKIYDDYSYRIKNRFKRSLEIIDIALEQHKVLNGELLMENLLADLKSSDLAIRKELLEILKVAKLVAKNLFLQDIKKIQGAKNSQDLNDISFTVENIENLRKHFPSWDFIDDEGSLRVVYRVIGNNKKEFDPESDVMLELSFQDGRIDYGRPGPSEEESDDGYILTQGLKTFKDIPDETGYIRTERLKTLQDLREKVKKEEDAKINYAEKFKKENE